MVVRRSTRERSKSVVRPGPGPISNRSRRSSTSFSTQGKSWPSRNFCQPPDRTNHLSRGFTNLLPRLAFYGIKTYKFRAREVYMFRVAILLSESFGDVDLAQGDQPFVLCVEATSGSEPRLRPRRALCTLSRLPRTENC